MQYSPIPRKHTKLSNDPIIQEEMGMERSTNRGIREGGKIKKEIKCYTEVEDYEGESEESSMNITKLKGLDFSQNEYIREKIFHDKEGNSEITQINNNKGTKK